MNGYTGVPTQRRSLVKLIGTAALAVVVAGLAAACGGGAAQPTAAPAKPAATSAPAAAATAAPAKPASGATAAPAAAATAPAKAAAAPAAGAQTVKLASVLTEDNPQHVAFLFFADRVKELTNGKLIIQVYPNSQLGSEREYIEGLQLGTIEFSKSSSAVLGPFVPEFQVLDLPFVFKSKEQLYKVVDGEVGQTLIKKLADKNGIKGLGYFDSGARGIFTSKRGIKTPADLKGMKIRVMENQLMIQTINAMGGAATPMAYGEVYSAIQQGVIDGAENPTVAYAAQKFYEPAKYYTFTDHFMTPDFPMMSLKWYNAQPKDIQEAVDKAAKEMVQKERDLWTANEKTVVDDLKAKGVQFFDTDKEAFGKLVEPLYQQFESKIGKDLMDKARSTK